MKLVLRTSINRTFTPYSYSLRDILATEELVTCRILVPIRGISKQAESRFNNTPFVKDLDKGQVVDLPWWMAGSLFNMDLQKVAVKFPPIYDRVHRDILKADPCAVPLERWSPFYYDVSIILEFFQFQEASAIFTTLLEVSRERWMEVVQKALNCYYDANTERRMPRSERDVFLIGREFRIRLEKWLRRGSMIEHTEIATDLRKRKENDTRLMNKWF